jgi:hypothetical protein
MAENFSEKVGTKVRAESNDSEDDYLSNGGFEN